jgi:uncharacterized lipoprotein YmbA
LKNPFKYFGLLTGLVMLVGCGSTPNVYYTLSPASSPEAVASSAPKPFLKPYSVSIVGVPPQVDDTPLIVRMADNRLLLLTHDRWTAPLGELIQNALAQNLTQQLGMPPVRGFDMTEGLGNATRVIVNVQRFDMVPGEFAELETVWEVRSADARVRPLICYSRLRQSVDIGVVPLVAAQQTNIKELSAEIAATLQSGKPPASVTCQAS